MTPLYQKFLDIQTREAWGELCQYTAPESWKQLLLEERQLLAQLFLKKGCWELAPVRRYPKNFRIAEELLPTSPDLFFQEAQLFLSDGSSPYHLIWAEKALARATQLAPHFLQAWILRVQVLLDLATDGRSNPYKKLQLAEKSFLHIQSLLSFPHQKSELLLARLEADMCFSKARLSGEPKDWQKTLDLYQQLEAIGYENAAFFFRFGEIYAQLGRLIQNMRFSKLALHYYDRSLAMPPPHPLALLSKTLLLADIAESEASTEALDASLKLFNELPPELPQALRNTNEQAYLWLRWGEIEMTLEKKKGILPNRVSGLEKLEKAYELSPNNLKVLSSCAEAQLTWGASQGCIFSLYQAKQKAERLLQLQPASADAHYLLGCCILEQGRYFDDFTYYKEAISQFQSGLSINPQHPILWYVLGAAHLALGEQTEDMRLIEKAARHFAKAQEYKVDNLPELWADWGIVLLKLAEYKQELALVEMAMRLFYLAIGLDPSGGALDQIKETFLPQADSFALHGLSHIGYCLDLIFRLQDDPIALEKAVDLLEKVLEVVPNFTETRYQLACSLTDLGYVQESSQPFTKAHRHFQELLTEHPENDQFHFDYALSLIGFVQQMEISENTDLYNEIEYHLQTSARLGNEEAYYHMGCLFAFLGKQDRAFFSLERALTAKALPPLEQILEEEWLSSLHGDPIFLQWIRKISPKKSGSKHHDT